MVEQDRNKDKDEDQGQDGGNISGSEATTILFHFPTSICLPRFGKVPFWRGTYLCHYLFKRCISLPSSCKTGNSLPSAISLIKSYTPARHYPQKSRYNMGACLCLQWANSNLGERGQFQNISYFSIGNVRKRVKVPSLQFPTDHFFAFKLLLLSFLKSQIFHIIYIYSFVLREITATKTFRGINSRPW